MLLCEVVMKKTRSSVAFDHSFTFRYTSFSFPFYGFIPSFSVSLLPIFFLFNASSFFFLPIGFPANRLQTASQVSVSSDSRAYGSAPGQALAAKFDLSHVPGIRCI